MSKLKLALDILQNEADGDIHAALKKMSADYSMTWMYKKVDMLFPSSSSDFLSDMKNIYPVKGRVYEIKNAVEGEKVVMIEMVESYPDLKTGDVFRTPVVIVLEFDGDKIKRGRHYCDPNISWLHLNPASVESGYKGTNTKQVIKGVKE